LNNIFSAPFFSVIVPVYNDEKNLPRCLDSIFSQNFDDFECLIINDGSTDSCPELCDLYSKKIPRIRVFHNRNQGISKTRQFGINNAAGSFIIFIDSDDWVNSQFLSEIRQTIVSEKPEMIFTDFFDENTFGTWQNKNQKPPDTDIETILKLVLEGRLFSCLWNIIINRDYIICKKIFFCENINYGEDSLFILELLLNNPKISYKPGAYYHHSCNSNSFTRKNMKQRFVERVNFLNYLPILLDKYNRNDLIKYNFFPLNDKYAMLCSMVFSKNEYQKIYTPLLSSYFLKSSGFHKFIMLWLAETNLYILINYYLKFLKLLKNKLLK
jgi:glycosyltransferase involved in cell wall biosynthesis